MELREEDLLSNLGKPSRDDDASDHIDFLSLQLGRTIHDNQNLVSSTTVAQIAPSLQRRRRRLNGSGRAGTCPMCKRSLINEHWRHLKDCGLRICNRCFYSNERAEKKARKEAETAGF